MTNADPPEAPVSIGILDALPASSRLDDVVRLADFEPIARSRMRPGPFDYVAGGAGDELSLEDSVRAWRRRRLRPRVLVDVSNVDPSTTFLGAPSALPLAIAPMSSHGLAHPDAECATAAAAAAAGVPFTLSTLSTRSIEDVAAAAPSGVHWFQLYVQRDRGVARSLCERAAAAGYRAIVLTVDLPVVGIRERDRRNGFSDDRRFGNFPAGGAAVGDPEVRLTWDDLATIRSWTGLPLVVKGILTAEDATLAVEHAVDAIVVSNHGARQLDRLPAPVDVLEEVVGAVDGRAEVWVDGGVRRGEDVATALALGARGVLVGRPILWALAAGGEAGVTRALAILREEIEVAFALLGTPTIGSITRDHAD